MEVLAFVALAVVILAAGIRVGMLVAPRVERMADRLAREAPGDTAEATATTADDTTEADRPPPEAIDRGEA